MKVKLKERFNYKKFEYDWKGLTKETIYKVLYINNDIFSLITDDFQPLEYPYFAFDIIDNSVDEIWKVNLLDEKYYKEDYYEGRASLYIGL